MLLDQVPVSGVLSWQLQFSPLLSSSTPASLFPVSTRLSTWSPPAPEQQCPRSQCRLQCSPLLSSLLRITLCSLIKRVSSTGNNCTTGTRYSHIWFRVSVDDDELKIVWKSRVSSSVPASLDVVDHLLVCCSSDGRIHIIDLESGELILSHNTLPGQVFSSPLSYQVISPDIND